MAALGFTNSEEVLDELTETVGRLCAQVTGYGVVEADSVIPKPEGPFILVDLTVLDPLDWATNEVMDEDGVMHTVHNYTVGYTLTAYRGKPSLALAKIHQAFGLPFLRERYFPTGSPFAYSSVSNISRMRVPLSQQVYENRARTIVNFNVVFVEKDTGVFEDVERIVIAIEAQDSNGLPLQGLEADADVNIPPGGNDPGPPPKPNPPITYHDMIAEVCMETPVIDKPALISDKKGA